MTITQTVEIPADHRLTIEVPREIPAGRAVLAFTPAPAKKHIDALMEILSQPTPRADALSGILSGLGDITLEQIREERLAKHFK